MLSKTNKTRSHIIETSIIIEELISKTLGLLLNIDWKTSETLGYKSSAISFNQKVQIIKDLKGIDKTIVKKLNYFMTIRNKFAHIREISSYEKFFEVTSNGLEIKNHLQKWYSNPQHSQILTESDYTSYFISLTSEIIRFLTDISIQHAYDKGYQTGKNDITARIVDALVDEIRKLDGGQDIIDRALNKIETEIENGTVQ